MVFKRSTIISSVSSGLEAVLKKVTMEARNLSKLTRKLGCKLEASEFCIISGLLSDVGCFTGYTRKQLQTGNRSDWTALLGQVDLLIDGPFISELRCDKPLRGSINQELYFLTGRIQPEEVSAPPRVELTLDADGGLTQTGFPETSDADAAREFLENFGSSAPRDGGEGEFFMMKKS